MIEGYAVLDRPDTVAAVVQQMVQMIAAADPDDSRLMFGDACRALRKVGAVQALHALRDVAVARVRDGLGGYQLSNVAAALAACGDFETAITAARQIPEDWAVIDVFGEIAVLLARHDRRDEAAQLFREAFARFERELERPTRPAGAFAEQLLSAAQSSARPRRWNRC